MREITEWADLVYPRGGTVVHYKPFGEGQSLCGEETGDWLGTGDFEEFEAAVRLYRCPDCVRHSRPAGTNWEEVVSASA